MNAPKEQRRRCAARLSSIVPMGRLLHALHFSLMASHFWRWSLLESLSLLKPRFGSVRLRFGGGTVRAVAVFGSGGSSAKRAFLCVSVEFNRKGRFRFRFRFLENGSGGSGSAFGFGKNGSNSSGSRFRFGS